MSTILTSDEELEVMIERVVTRAIEKTILNFKPETVSEDLLKIEDAANLLKVSVSTINNWKRDGKIPFRQIGKRIYFDKTALLKSVKNLSYAG